MNYTILRHSSYFDLIDQVNIKMKKGLHPIGGVAVEVIGHDSYYMQAMVEVK